jgi:hypothetical protein
LIIHSFLAYGSLLARLIGRGRRKKARSKQDSSSIGSIGVVGGHRGRDSSILYREPKPIKSLGLDLITEMRESKIAIAIPMTLDAGSFAVQYNKEGDAGSNPRLDKGIAFLLSVRSNEPTPY